MLAAVDRDHLARDAGRACQDTSPHRRSRPGTCPRPSSTAALCCAKSSSACRTLVRVGPGPIALTRIRGASAWAMVCVAAEQRRLGQSVGVELGRELPDSLVDDIDDAAVPPGASCRAKSLRQEDGRAQVDRRNADPSAPASGSPTSSWLNSDALLTNRVNGPSARTALAIKVPTAFGSVRSASTTAASPPRS